MILFPIPSHAYNNMPSFGKILMWCIVPAALSFLFYRRNYFVSSFNFQEAESTLTLTVTLVATHALTHTLHCPPPSHTSHTTQVGDTGYGFQTTADEIAAGLDLSDAGRHTSALVTGATGGLGFETARVLASRGAHVFVCGRTAAKAQKAVAAIEKAVGKGVGVLTPVACALGSLADVQSCADAVTLLNKPLDLLVLNAGIAWLTKPTTYGNRIPYTHTHYTHTHTHTHTHTRSRRHPSSKSLIPATRAVRNNVGPTHTATHPSTRFVRSCPPPVDWPPPLTDH